MEKIFGYESFELKNDSVELYVTRKGGQMAPVVFFPGSGNPVSPYYINPWNGEEPDPSLPVLLQALRGDFFCLPFGGDNTTEEFSYGPHGPTANEVWKLAGRSRNSLRIALDFPDGKAHVETEYMTKPGHSCLYITNTISDCPLNLPYGHHCILDSSSTLLISTSPVRFGIITQESDTPTDGQGEYRALMGHEVFSSLEKAPSRLKDQPFFDLSAFPAREGFCDIAQMVNDPEAGELGWSVAVCPDKGYLWFSAKKIADFPSTLLWMENKGRHGKPWSGRNVCIGIEDALSCFAAGAKLSTDDNPLSEMGIQTSRQFSTDKPVVLRIIEGVARIPEGFGRVSTVDFNAPNQTAVFTDVNGMEVSTAVDPGFLG